MSRCALLLLASLIAAATPCAAGSVTVTNGPPLHADGEVSAHARLPAWSGRERAFRLEIAHAAASSNNVEVAFGRDADGDGLLPAEEAALTVGWLAGRWFALSEDQRALHAAGAAGGETNRVLTLSVRLGPDLAPRWAACTDETGAAVVLEGFGGTLAAARPAEWDTARLTARGPDACGGAVKVSLIVDGTLLLLR